MNLKNSAQFSAPATVRIMTVGTMVIISAMTTALKPSYPLSVPRSFGSRDRYAPAAYNSSPIRV